MKDGMRKSNESLEERRETAKKKIGSIEIVFEM